jgi:nucleotide-binding universal stress UspA family protein
MLPIQHILVPTDFSEPAEQALEYARGLAREFGSHLHLLHVVPEPHVYPWGTEMPTVAMTGLLTETEQAASDQLRTLAKNSRLPADQVTVSVKIGSPVSDIIEYVGRHHIDLVVMGTHGRSTLEHFLLGSVAERIVRRSPTAVLTVHGATRTAELKAKSMMKKT